MTRLHNCACFKRRVFFQEHVEQILGVRRHEGHALVPRLCGQLGAACHDQGFDLLLGRRAGQNLLGFLADEHAKGADGGVVTSRLSLQHHHVGVTSVEFDVFCLRCLHVTTDVDLGLFNGLFGRV